ncbi:hypothetical protein NQ318_007777 [Aromia moschata]|uniref:Uncharacterized protein n=1 Tax=Aromia moschata TaxID=1265417 RepID=A0AAV8YZS8_9CUCU|nr:hypothetical protein NQ318_007777 [Aromia moschata]
MSTSLYTRNRRQLACGLVATETFLGWTLMGKISTRVPRSNDQKLLNQYQEIFDEWAAEEIIERVSRYYSDVEQCHYLPHRPVVKSCCTL